MRVEFRFQIKELPIGYRLGILSIIKEMIRLGSEQYYEEIFIKKEKDIKPFSYATYIHNLLIHHDKIYGDQLVLTVSSSSYEWFMHLINGSSKMKEFYYKNNCFLFKSKRMLPSYTIKQPIATFSTKSPLLLESKDKKPVLSNDSNFEKELQYISSLIIEELYNRKPYQPLRVLNTSMKKQVIKENLHNDQNELLYLTTNKGYIQLEGHPDDLQAIYENGVGYRRSLGLGFLDIKEVTEKEWSH